MESRVAPQTQQLSFSDVIASKWFLIIIGIIAAICILGTFLYLKSTNPNNLVLQSGEIISGTVDINGVVPQGSSISIVARRLGSQNFQTVASNITAVDGIGWMWNGAEKNVAYEVKAILKSPVGSTVSESNLQTIVAPAVDETLRIQSSYTPSGSQAQNTSVSGTIDLNGYIPPGATIAIGQQQSAASQPIIVASGINAVDGAVWSWTTAQAGATYQFIAYLQLNGVTISQSPTQTITAPANNEVLVINSTATPVTPTVVGISGIINLNGSVPSNSYITLGVRPTGTTQFNQVATNIAATNGSTWSWTAAQAGTSYDLQAYLWSNGAPSNQSQILTVVAPAANEILTINAQAQPSTPAGNTISVSCQSLNTSSNLWQVQINFNTNSSAPSVQQYWLTVGSSSQGNQFVNNITSPSNSSNPNSQQSYTTGFSFTSGQTYFAQWAYSTCSNCNTFSSFSPSVQFSCTPAQPTNTPTPTPTNTPTPTSTPVPTSTPTPTNTPTPIPPTNASLQ